MTNIIFAQVTASVSELKKIQWQPFHPAMEILSLF